MHDLGILDTPFAARVVLGVAVAEDIVLYVILAVSLGLARDGTGGLLGAPSLAGIGPGTAADMAYHVGGHAGRTGSGAGVRAAHLPGSAAAGGST